MHVSFQNSINKGCFSRLYWLKVVTHFFFNLQGHRHSNVHYALQSNHLKNISRRHFFPWSFLCLTCFWNFSFGMASSRNICGDDKPLYFGDALWLEWSFRGEHSVKKRSILPVKSEGQLWSSNLVPVHTSSSICCHCSPSYTVEFSSLTSCSQDSAPAIPPEWNGTVFHPDPSGNILLIHHAPAHIQPFCDASPLPMRQNSTEGKNTDMRVQRQGSREAAAQPVMCMDHGARLPGSESCPYNVATSSVILDELHHFPMSQIPQ